MINKFCKAGLLILSLVNITSSWAELTASVNSTNVAENETIDLEITADSIERQELDFSVLQKDFHIESTAKQFFQSNVNGQYTKKTVWHVGLTAKRIGNLTIPAFTVNQASSQPLSIKVTKTLAEENAPNKNLFIKTQLEPDTHYENAAIMLTVKIFVAENTRLNQLELKMPELQDINIFHIKDSQSKQVINNKTYQVIARKFALFSSKAGDLTIDNLSVVGAVAEPNSASNDGFFNLMSLKPIRIHIPAINLHIQAPPQGHRDKYWLPSASVTATQHLEPTDDLKVGDVITRTITLRAQDLAANYLPEPYDLLPKPHDAQHIKVYKDKAKYNTQVINGELYGSVTQEISYIVNKVGDVKLGGFQLGWWNVATNQPQVLELAAQQFNIAAQAAVSNSAVPLPTLAPIATPQTQQELFTIGFLNYKMLWVAAILGSIIVSLYIGMYWQKLRFKPQQKKRKRQQAPQPATENMQGVVTLESILNNLQQSAQHNNLQQVYATFMQLQQELAKQQVPAQQRHALLTLLEQLHAMQKELECSIYNDHAEHNAAKVAAKWDGAKFWQHLEQALAVYKVARKNLQHDPQLSEL